MLIDSVMELYRELRLRMYKNIFSGVHERQGSLSATELFSADTINIMGTPTVTEFADNIGISQPNATYKVNSLVTKGYLEKIISDDDRRETHLHVSEKFMNYLNRDRDDVLAALDRVKSEYSEAELKTTEKVIKSIIKELSVK